MSTGAVGKRYARAILELANEQKQIERTGKELNELATMWAESKELQELFANPSFTAAARKTALTEILSRAMVSPLVKNSLLYLSDSGRLAALPDVARLFTELAATQAGTVRAVVTSAGPLSDAYYGQLQRALEQATGKKVSIEKKTDASLIAGVVTRVGDQVFDGSLRARLGEMKESLRPV